MMDGDGFAGKQGRSESKGSFGLKMRGPKAVEHGLNLE